MADDEGNNDNTASILRQLDRLQNDIINNQKLPQELFAWAVGYLAGVWAQSGADSTVSGFNAGTAETAEFHAVKKRNHQLN